MRDLFKDKRVRSLISLFAVLVFYFVVPIDASASPVRLTLSVIVALLCVGLVAMAIIREFRRMQLGLTLKFTGGQLLIVLELVLVVFSLIYFTLAVHRTNEMVGITTRVDALYFTATTIATVGYGDIHSIGQVARVINTIQLVFDVLFVAAFVRLLATAASEREKALAKQDKHED